MIESFIFYSLRILIVLIGVLPILYWYLTRNNDYWTKQGISGPKPMFIFGNFLDRVKNNMGVIDIQYMKEFGNVYGTFDGTEPVLKVTDPELIKQILVKEFHLFNNRRDLRTEHPILNKNLFHSRDNNWKRLRTIMSSMFSSKKMKTLYPLIKESLQEYLDHLDRLAQSGDHLNVKFMYDNLTLDVITSCIFATKTNALKDPSDPLLMICRTFFQPKAILFIPAFVFPKFLNRLLNIKSAFDIKSSESMFRFIRHLIEEKRKSSEKTTDILQLLINAKIDDQNIGDTNEGLESHYRNEDDKNQKLIVDKHFANKSLSEDEIIAQSWVFLLAGYETTSTALGYFTYELALNPECQQKLYNELKTAMDSNNEISYDDLHRLPYLDACISETLRKYPPVTRLEREVNQDIKLGDSEIKLYKGQLVEIPVFAIQRSEEYYANPDQFIPERFLGENRNQIIPYTFIPFGTGPRHCIGMRFALMEIKSAMAHILLRYRFTKCDKTESELDYLPLTPLLASKSITIGIEKR